MSFVRLVALCLPLFVNLSTSSEHTYGIPLAGSIMVHRELFRSSSPVPRNYTIIFRSIGADSGQNFHYAKINVENNTSHGVLMVNADKQYIEATITIPNGINVVVTFSTYTSFYTYMNTFGQNVSQAPHSFTVVHIQDPVKANGIPFQHNAVGQRQPNDKLIHFSSQNVTTTFNNFPSNVFEYAGAGGVAISYVGFTFDSPTAVVSLNSTLIGENQLSAFLYDLATTQFVANVSIFGYTRKEKPINFLPIVRV